MATNSDSWLGDGLQYLTEVRSEFRKITWPSQKEYLSGTVGVVIIVAILTLILGVFDFALTEVMELILGD